MTEGATQKDSRVWIGIGSIVAAPLLTGISLLQLARIHYFSYSFYWPGVTIIYVFAGVFALIAAPLWVWAVRLISRLLETEASLAYAILHIVLFSSALALIPIGLTELDFAGSGPGVLLSVKVWIGPAVLALASLVALFRAYRYWWLSVLYVLLLPVGAVAFHASDAGCTMQLVWTFEAPWLALCSIGVCIATVLLTVRARSEGNAEGATWLKAALVSAPIVLLTCFLFYFAANIYDRDVFCHWESGHEGLQHLVGPFYW
jgi:hypothetical protein